MVARMRKAFAFVVVATACGGNTAASSTQAPAGTASAQAVNGWIDPPIIQRIVRHNFGRFRLCYENGLRTNPKLQGRVTVKFVIDRSGAVAMVRDGGSTMPDQGVVQCVVHGFGGISFPQPQGGMVTVVYPIQFNPAPDDDAGTDAGTQADAQ
jgi:hypothetical protein